MRHLIIRWCAALFVSAMVLVALAPGRAHAQSASELASARELFEQGTAAAREGRWEDARQAFEGSLAIAERASTLLNLAGAQTQTGQLVEAAVSYRRLLEIARGRDARHRAQATEALRDVESRVAYVRVAAAGLTGGDSVALDGRALDGRALGGEIAVNPGAHALVVLRAGDEVARESFAIGEGQHRTVAIEVAAVRAIVAVDVGAGEVSPVVGAGEPVAEPQGDDLTWLWVTLGIAAAAGIAIGVGVGVTSGSAPTTYQGNLGDGTIRF